MKKLLKFGTLALLLLVLVQSAFAVNSVTLGSDVLVDYVKINGDEYLSGENLDVELGDDLDFRVKLQSIGDAEDVRVIVNMDIDDSRYQTYDETSRFDMDNGSTKYVDLGFTLPTILDKDLYTVTVEIRSNQGLIEIKSFNLDVEGADDAIAVRDIILSPSGSVVAGRALLAQLRLENVGQDSQDDVKVTARIPALNIVESIYVEELESERSFGRGDKETTEEIYMRIPQCAAQGLYVIEFDVEFRDGSEAITVSDEILVLESELCPNNAAPTVEERTVITAPQSQSVQIGVGGASYPVVIQNAGSTSKVYTVSVIGVDAWGTYQVSEQTPIIAAGESKVVYVYVTANEGTAQGMQTFGIDIATQGGKETIMAQANIVQPQQTGSNVVQILTISVIVLVAILVLLGIIVVISKLKGNDDDMEKGKAYY